MSIVVSLGFIMLFALALLERYRPGSLVGGRDGMESQPLNRTGQRSTLRMSKRGE